MEWKPNQKVFCCGGSSYYDSVKVTALLALIRPGCVIVGSLRGCDLAAYTWARDNGVPTIVMSANSKSYGPRGGPIRNRWVLKWCRPDLVVVFPGGAGVRDMVLRAQGADIPVVECTSEEAQDD